MSRARQGQLRRAQQPLDADVRRLAFITPVYKRHDLTDIIMEHRARMIERCRDAGLDCIAILVGDEVEHRRIAIKHGLQWVEHPNEAPALGAKFNAGYNAAKAAGATHAFAIGSDSWLHWDSIADVVLWPKAVTSFPLLTAMRADGLERTDLRVQYAAGFGVGMIYPTLWLPEEPCDPTKARGCDGSTWNRTGHGKLGIKWHEVEPCAFVNFASPDVQVTDYRKLSAHRRTSTVVKARNMPTRDAMHEDRLWRDLVRGEDGDLVRRVMFLYAARSVGAFLTGKTYEERLHEKPKDWAGGIWPPKDGKPRRPLARRNVDSQGARE